MTPISFYYWTEREKTAILNSMKINKFTALTACIVAKATALHEMGVPISPLGTGIGKGTNGTIEVRREFDTGDFMAVCGMGALLYGAPNRIYRCEGDKNATIDSPYSNEISTLLNISGNAAAKLEKGFMETRGFDSAYYNSPY